MSMSMSMSIDQLYMEQLYAKVRLLEIETIGLKAEAEARQQRTLLGQVAFAMDEQACEYVFRGQLKVALTIWEINKRAERWELTPVQDARWKDFARFLRAQEWSVSDINALTKPLRAGRFVDPVQKRTVTLQELEKWAQYHLLPSQLDGFKSFTRLVAKFAVDGRVLSNAGNAVSVVQACLKQMDAETLAP